MIENNPNKFNKFKHADRYKLVIGFDSTLILEIFGRGIKSLIINFKSSLKKDLSSYDLFWPQKQSKELDFYLNEYDVTKLRKKLDKLLSLNDQDWKKRYYEYKNLIMNYSYKNKILNKAIKEIIDGKNI